MLCSMCQHGIAAKRCWTCDVCKEVYCPHIHTCTSKGCIKEKPEVIDLRLFRASAVEFPSTCCKESSIVSLEPKNMTNSDLRCIYLLCVHCGEISKLASPLGARPVRLEVISKGGS